MKTFKFEGSKGPWKISPAILRVYSSEDSNQVCKITRGDWGDTYPVIKSVGSSLLRTYEADIEMIVYGHTPQEVAKKNAALISTAPELLEICLEIFKEIQLPSGKYQMLEKVINKALGYEID